MHIRPTKNYEIIAKLNRHVHSLHAALYPKHFKKYNYPEVRETFKYLIDNDQFIFLLLEDHKKAIGYVWIEIIFYPENAFRKSYESIYVHQIGLRADQKKKGYGTLLMDEVYTIAKKHDIELIELDYWFENTDAKEFYKKHQFSNCREFVYKQL
ncbi:GNAT family N-acetyltransferase [Peribacillus sp. FSL H8-0477]|uniref:GNAT family N-acetyltransferase n=1 Tax=Peribacillus sp. FSL H8-0477 TaxID=2921388 RepID=UPI0030FBCBF0